MKSTPSSSSSPASSTSFRWRQLREKQQLSRLLYGNPVCLLTTAKRPALGYHRANAMTISWLTPVDNQGNIFLSINTRRHTAERLMKEYLMGTTTTDDIHRTESHDGQQIDVPSMGSHDSGSTKTFFVLNIPTAGQEDLVLRIGGCSGRDVDKFAQQDATEQVKQRTEEETDSHEVEEDQLPMNNGRMQETNGTFTLCRPGWASCDCAEGSDETMVESSMFQTASSPAASSAAAAEKVEPEATSGISVRGRRKAVMKMKSPTDDCGGNLVAIRECIAHLVCR